MLPALMILAALLMAPALARADVLPQHALAGTCPICGQAHAINDDDPPAFRLSSRWSSTFTNGGGLTQGTHTTITWSIVPDGTTIPAAFPDSGEVTGPSDLVSQFDAAFGVVDGDDDYTNRPWFFIFQSPFERWSQLAALDYIYVNDDGVEMNNANSGSATRGDVRIGGHNISGAGSILAYNYYPNRGDMVNDTSDINFFTNPTDNYRAGRNIIAHEHGHGVGIAHLESSDGQFLMEPRINTNFDGPQFDDILSAQRHYGDVLEKNGGNDTAATAYDFGPIADGSSAAIGFDADDTVVAFTDVSFVSIDDESDVDFYSFSVDDETGVILRLTPMGPTYMEGAQGGTQSAFVTSARSDLTLKLLDTDGSTVIKFQNERGLGGYEGLFYGFQTGGTYFLEIAGLTSNMIQMYQLELTGAPIPEPAGAVLLAGAALLMLRRRAA